MTNLPLPGEVFSKMTHHLREAQGCAAMLAHLERDNHPALAKGWLNIEDLLKRVVTNILQMKTGRMH